jgi:AraC-like DNA-binding protein
MGDVPPRGHSRYTASARILWPVLDTFQREKWDIGRLLEPFALAENALQDPDLRIPQDVVTDVWDRAAEISGDPSLGLRALRSLSPRRRGLAEYLLFNCPTVGAMIERGIRYERLWQEGREASLERGPRFVTLHWTARAGVRFSAPLSEFSVAMIVLMARAATGQDLRSCGGEVRFLHPAPSDLAEYEALFAGPVRFSAGEQAIEFERELLETPLPKADPALLAELERHGTEVLERLPTARSVAQSVRQVLAANLGDGVSSLDAVAASLRMSGRTLRRRLGDEGTTFQDILDEFRRELALRYLDDPTLSVTEVAFLLAYGDTAAFTKAFRRWTGRTPSAARARKTGS